MKKLADLSIQIIYLLFTLLLLGVVILNLAFSSKNYPNKRIFLLENTELLMLGFIILCLLWGASIFFSKVHFHLNKPSINTLTIILFFSQVYIFFNIYFRTEHWDPAIIYYNAEIIARGETEGLTNSYFSNYPNNQLIVYLQSIMLKVNQLIGIFDYEGVLFIILIQCTLTSLTGKLLYGILDTLTHSKKCSLSGWLLFVILLGLSGWNVVTYTDMMALIFPILIFRVYLSLRNNKSVVRKWIFIITLTYWGSKIKPTVAIIFIAILIAEAIAFAINFEHKKTETALRLLGKVIVIGALHLFVYNTIFTFAIKSTGLLIDKEANLGTFHMIMMGLNPVNNGVYFQEDVDFSKGFATKSERTHAQVDMIKQRINAYGLSGFLQHMGKKSLINFNDGTFAWEQEGGFYDIVYPDKNNLVSPFLKSLYYSSGSKYQYLSTAEQLAWLVVLFLSIGIVFIKKSKETLTIILSLAGIIIFTFLFEARARYIMLYVPFFILAAMLSLQKCQVLFSQKTAEWLQGVDA